jgi:hypothetical protein
MLKWMKKNKSAEASSSASPLEQRSSSPRKPSLGAPRSSPKRNSGFIDSAAIGLNNEGKKSDSIWRGHSKSFKRSKYGNSKNAAVRQEFPWGDMVARFGEEIGESLTEAMNHLHNACLLHPLAAASIGRAVESIEHAKRASMIAQKFARLRAGASAQAPELLDLREVVGEVIEQRSAWLQKNRIKARAGLLSARVNADPAALFSLIDELANWAGNIAAEIGFGIDEEAHSQRPRLRVFAKVDPASLPEGSWENVGWFLWHQLARSMGAQAELQVLSDALTVCVTFPLPPPEDQSVSSSALELDADIANIISGCRVVVVSPDEALREAAFLALGNLRLDLKTTWSVEAARESLGNSVPHAVVYDGRMDAGKIMQMRNDFAPHGKVAFIELSESGSEQFQVSALGSMSTAHVYVPALALSLAPALVFELCKVI